MKIITEKDPRHPELPVISLITGYDEHSRDLAIYIDGRFVTAGEDHSFAFEEVTQGEPVIMQCLSTEAGVDGDEGGWTETLQELIDLGKRIGKPVTRH